MNGAREADPSSVGMMEGAFFVSRTELLEWVNNLLYMRLNRVEQCASGCVYIQIIDALFNGSYPPLANKVPMSKVKWSAKHEYEYIQNYKILQSVFNKNNINKHVEVDRLIKAKYQDNLEFLQWIKAFYDRMAHALHNGSVPYNPIERRKLGIGPYPDWAPVTGDVSMYTPAPAAAASSDMKASAPVNTSANNIVKARTVKTQKNKENNAPSGRIRGSPNTKAPEESEDIDTKLQQACLERNFYYSKLRRIEILCSQKENISVQELQNILYATDEDEYLCESPTAQ